MHLGNARTAMLAWLQVRALNGTMALRVEDLDTQRVVAGVEDRLLDELRWLGLDWDEGPVRQSERAASYSFAIRRLLDEGKAFECACSRAEIARAASAPHVGEEGARYPGTCRDRAPGVAARRAAAAGRTTAIRFKSAGERIRFTDLVRGDVDPLGEAGLDDFVIQRVDRIAAYQLAVVVDDAAMRVTHVLRADDLLDSTPRQLALYRALGLEAPVFAHVPLVLAPGGDRLAKRNRPLAVGDLRAAGVVPATIVGMLAASAGLVPHGTQVAAKDLVAAFDLARISREPATLDGSAFGVTAPFVRPAEGSDVISLAEIYVGSWRAAYHGIVPDAVLDALSVVTQTARWQKMLAGMSKGETRAFVIEEQRAIRGFVVTGPVRGDTEEGVGEVWAMYLDPTAWRRGLGRALLAHAERDLVERGYDRLVLWVLAKNAGGRAFYSGVGFAPTGEARVNPIGGAPLEEARYARRIGR